MAVLDANHWTAWWSNWDPSQQRAWLIVDLQSPSPVALSCVRWFLTSSAGAADYVIEVSNDGAAWTALNGGRTLPAGNGVWLEVDAPLSARLVQFRFANPTRASRLGGLGTVDIHGAP
jgi:hypothetical protein